MESIMEEEDVPTVTTESQPEGELEASEEAAAEESKHDDELKASDEVVPEEFKYEESKASEEAVAEEFKVSDEAVADEFKYEELNVSDEAVSEESKPEEEFKASDEAVSEESKPEEEFKASDEAVSEESKPEEEFKASDEAVSEESKIEAEFQASDEAVSFLTSIEPEELQKCVFSETLMVMSESGGILGEFSVSVEFTHRALEPCVILHARSHGAIDGSPCGTTVTAYLTADLEVLEEDYHEYVKLDSYNVEKRSHMVQRGKQMVINKFTVMGEDVTEEECVSYPMSVLRGLVTEGSSMLLMRLMALRKKVPKNMVFIILDQSLHINQTTFSELDVKEMQVRGETVEVFGLERMVGSADADHSTWHCYFLDNGYLASRKQVGSPVTMKFIQELSKKGRGRMKIPLVWQEDMQLYSLYLDKKDFLKAEHNSYLREHPELRALLSDFIQDLLIVKPDNIFQFAREYFPPYSTYHSPESNPKTPSP
ncbi:ciliogenesis-associated TTC17-interacting protein isoform X1 [Poecilia formosa]|uniref:ciliogenesis-associated TTC17-interacting protein isoform X1 n=1 Tax=Poecilia formosa TaxID=48698 RepID=UPI0007BA5B5F|nr:PREDICTED: ciliogenesis-associated TTC17-interacting protein isoform X1 [Poecilia formosa]